MFLDPVHLHWDNVVGKVSVKGVNRRIKSSGSSGIEESIDLLKLLHKS